MTVRAGASFAEANKRIRDALKVQGFGVLTEIDVQSTLREKLAEDMEDVIIGACNPPLAHRALSADRTIGLLLPCNVVVRAGDGCTIVEALDPRAIADIAGQPVLKDIAEDRPVGSGWRWTPWRRSARQPASRRAQQGRAEACGRQGEPAQCLEVGGQAGGAIVEVVGECGE
jgi:uncharacterized protein (DUF302 family)